MATKSKFEFDKKGARLIKAVQDAMTIIATDSENHFKRSFRNEGFEDEVVEKWQPRKRPSRADKNNPFKKRAILTQSGALKRSVLRRRLNAYKYRVESDLPYSAIHNYGLYGRAWGKHRFKMPQRRFMGISKKLMRKNVLTLKRQLTKAFYE
jgi:phage gpG-like protein